MKFFITLFKYLKDDFNNIKILNFIMLLFLISTLTFFKLSSILIYIILFLFLLNKNVKNYIQEILNNKVVRATILYFLIYILWMISSENLDVALYQVKGNLIMLYPILFVSIVRKEYIQKFIFAFFLVMFISSIWSFLMYFDLLDSPFRVTPRPIPFLYKSDFGFFLLIGISLAILNIKKYKGLYKFSLYILVFLFSINIFIIGARIYMFDYFILIISLLILSKNSLNKKYFFLLLTIFMLISTILYTYNDNLKNNIDNVIVNINKGISNHEYNTSSGIRVALIINSIPVLLDNFIFGVGTGDHIEAVKDYIYNKPDFNTGIYTDTINVLSIGKSSFLHNTYIQHIIEFGLIGLLVFLNIFYQMIRYKYINEDYKKFIITLSIIYLFMSVSGAEFMYNQAGKIFIFFISIFLVQKELYKTKENQK